MQVPATCTSSTPLLASTCSRSDQRATATHRCSLYVHNGIGLCVALYHLSPCVCARARVCVWLSVISCLVCARARACVCVCLSLSFSLSDFAPSRFLGASLCLSACFFMLFSCPSLCHQGKICNRSTAYLTFAQGRQIATAVK